MLIFVIATIIILIFLWIFDFISLNDFSVPSKDISKFKNVLFIYPHPDDEVFAGGGIIRMLSKQGSNVTLLILTKGEKGTKDAQTDYKLKEIRTKELRKSALLLGVTKLIHEDFGDGKLSRNKLMVARFVLNFIKDENPDLIITYDQSGLYGHPDHIACSQIVSALVKEVFNNIPLWYITLPQKTLKNIKLSEFMAIDLNFRGKRTIPTHKIFIGFNIIKRLQAIQAHESQHMTFKEIIPFRFIPVWFVYSTMVFEYYHEASLT